MIQEAATELVEPEVMMRDDDLHEQSIPFIKEIPFRKCSSYERGGCSGLMIKTFMGKT